MSFADEANRHSVTDDDCIRYGGRVLAHDEYDRKLKLVLKHGAQHPRIGTYYSYGGHGYAVYVDASPWWGLIGVTVGSVGLCEF